jgi:hypothetical protein
MPITFTSFTPSTIARSAQINANFQALKALLDGLRPQIHWFLPDLQVVGTNVAAQIKISSGVNLFLSAVTLLAETAPTGAAMIVDIKKNGSTIFTVKPQIADGATSGGSAATFAIASVANGDILTIDMSQVGSTEPGRDVTVGLSFYL